jgi:SNF2 family DNA or RNA helicase
MIVEYSAESQTFILHTGHHEKDLAKQVPGASWGSLLRNVQTQSRGAWEAPATWPAYIAINGLFAATMRPEPSYVEWAQAAWTNRYGPLTQLRFQDDADLGDGPTVKRLWPLQRVAVQAMVWSERYLEMDEMGGGKTATTLAALKMAAALHGEEAVFPALIVCPNKVRRSWRKIALEELTAGEPGLWPELRLEIMPKGKPAQRKVLKRFAAWHDPDNYYRENPDAPPPPQVLVLNWESLHTLSRVEAFGQIELTEKDKTPGELNKISWQTVVADEAHRMKDRRAKQTRALKAVANGTPSVGTQPARFRFALTGTPIANNSADAWSILNFLDPVGWSAYSRFIDRYATKVWTRHGSLEIGGLNPQTAEEFHATILPISIRRLRQQFDPFKPRVVMQTLTVPMETKQATAYKSLNDSMLAQLENGTLTATDGMSKANRLRQLAQAHGEMVDKGRKDPITDEPLLDLLLKAPSNKVNAMMELIDDFGITGNGPSDSQRSIVFGAASRQLIGLCEDALKKAGIPYTLIAGNMKDAEQELQERNFELGNTRVALCVISAAREGINSLIRADTLVFLQKSDSRNDNAQFQARIDRPGQREDTVTIIDLVSEGTLEEFEQIESLAKKYEHFQQVVQDARVLHAMLRFKGIS